MKGLKFFDGETINNKYILLSNQDNFILNKKGLTAKESLSYLVKEGKGNYNYFFRVEYDINMILKNEKVPQEFFESEEVIIQGFKIQYFRNKILVINNISFYDISSLFNKSFIYTLDKLKINYESESKLLKKYKGLRSEFSLSDIENIIQYNKIECTLGIKIINKLKEIIPDNLFTYKFYGSSAIANQFLNENNIQQFTGDINFFIPELFEKNSYFGGRMEAFKIGTFRNIYKYDINSAYPDIIKDLRSIENFKLCKYKNQKIIDSNLYYIELIISDKNLPGLLPVRLKTGYLLFPDQVKGWYYGIEIKAVIEYSKKYLLSYSIKEFYQIDLGDKIFKNNVIESIYNKRLELKKLNDEKQYIFKILLNSCYGKFAQKIGKAQFQNFYFAGLITSSVRSRLLLSIIDNPYDIIFFATDGILSKKKLKLKISDKLGDFEEIKIKEAVVLLSGVYKLTDYSGKVYFGERGYKMNFDKALKQIIKNKKAVVNQNSFIGIKYYSKNKKAFSGKKCKFTIIKKIINPLNQIKRIFNIDNFDVQKNYNSYLVNYETIKEKIINEITGQNNKAPGIFESFLTDKGKFYD